MGLRSGTRNGDSRSKHKKLTRIKKERGKGVAALALSDIAISSNWRISWPDKQPQDTLTQIHTPIQWHATWYGKWHNKKNGAKGLGGKEGGPVSGHAGNCNWKCLTLVEPQDRIRIQAHTDTHILAKQINTDTNKTHTSTAAKHTRTHTLGQTQLHVLVWHPQPFGAFVPDWDPKKQL